MTSDVVYMVQNAFCPHSDIQSMVCDDPACPEGILSIFSKIENLTWKSIFEFLDCIIRFEKAFEANFIF